MPKISNPQAIALVGLHYHGRAEGSRQNTVDSLFTNGLAEWDAEHQAKVTAKGYQAYQALTGVDLLAPTSVTVTDEEAFKAQAIENVTPVVQSIPPVTGRMVVNPGPTFVERPNTVHGGHTVAQVDSLIVDYRRHGLTDDEISERLDTWHLRQNRADRRAQVHARKVANRLDMRQARTPKRRRYLSPEAREQKARDASFTRNRLDFMAESGIV